MLGAVPADEGLHSANAFGGDIKHRLVGQRELFAFDGQSQVMLQCHAAQRDLGQRSVVKLRVVPTGVFGQVHGGVGVLEQGGCVDAVVTVQ